MRIASQTARGRRGARAATLVELMISLLVFGLLTTALVYMNLFCLKQDELVNAKLGANDSSRLSFDLMQTEIRASKNVLIGYGSYSNFTSLTNGVQQQGDTLMIIPSTNLSVYIYYYFITNNGVPELCRMDSSTNSSVIATYLTNMVTQWQTNGMIFQAMDYTGTNILTVSPTNYNHNYVVSVLLQFSQYQYPQTIVGSNYFFNYYQLVFNATRRSPEPQPDMKTPPIQCRDSRAGYSLFMTLILIGAMMITISATMSRMVSSAKMNDRMVSYTVGQSAAEAAVSKVMARMMVDYANNGEGTIVSNLSFYQSFIPNSSENPFWTNFAFLDGMGNSNRIYIARTTTNANPPYVALQSQYPGLNGFASTYRIMSNVTPLYDNYNFTNALQMDVQMAQIPIFQFAIFYNSLLEFTWAAPFTVLGRVYCNTNIYVGSSSSLSFSNVVSSSSTITNPAWGGYTQGQYTGSITYGGLPAPGYDTGAPTLTLPVGTNNSSAAVLQILYPSPSGEAVTSPMGEQRYSNKAGMVIMVSNATVTVTLQNPPFSDSSPITITNWNNASNNINYFFSTNVTFGDERENKIVRASQIDVGKFNTWMATNVLVLSKFNSTAPLNIVYVGDWRVTNGANLSVVRLMDAATLPTYGLTLATPNPLYIWGNYNCPNASNLSSTNVLSTVPASVICDALTILSSAWTDSASLSGGSPSSLGSRAAATSTTVDAAIMAGVVYTTGSSGSAFSGGVMNMTRLLENWGNGGSVTLTLNTSIVNFYGSMMATNVWQSPGVYYYAPTREFNFNQNYTSAAGLPPGTPQICRMIRASWCPPPPGVTNYAPPILDYVPD